MPSHTHVLRSLSPRARLSHTTTSPVQPRGRHPPRRSLATSPRTHALLDALKPAHKPELAGTAPQHHAFVLLHSPTPISAFPAKPSSPLQRSLLLSLLSRQVQAQVNFVWNSRLQTSQYAQILDGSAPSGEGEQVEGYTVTAHGARGTVTIPDVYKMGEGRESEGMETLLAWLTSDRAVSEANADVDGVHIYVCTHGSHDCRCGDTGGAVYAELQAEVTRRGVEDKVRLAEVAHVGGHKYAANVLVYPHGEWLGNVMPEDVPRILDAVSRLPLLTAYDPSSSPPALLKNWRGRMGLSKEEMLEMYRAHS